MFNKLYEIPLVSLSGVGSLVQTCVESILRFYAEGTARGHQWWQNPCCLPQTLCSSFESCPGPLPFSFCHKELRVSLETALTLHALLFSQVAGMTPSCSRSSAASVLPQLQLGVLTGHFLKMYFPASEQAASPLAEPVNSLQSHNLSSPRLNCFFILWIVPGLLSFCACTRAPSHKEVSIRPHS